ncbi:MAG TPA: LysM peptidoglycan-binding domain-containing protein [Flavobacteriaceae bacterium]|nr:LysM peptidoglycan-binding domain-containing protein [Flavobacteriaceae bacterium]MCB9211933.1 LysM peptidoglycan-binding domain-containing protein [Alteromonas sp.]HPF09973.1 LysM peptidoglycan-binding domain-containing protein [Flavobacteriaceae bacterium]HQU20070.1 LysM peptidoglycan-binding domain-containing protein [Flavobacteriaceae bacterium]HQU63944.1 LysM peptidoglycan-binding domain-containing protein [Flavobacteriaceae bacterium]
MPMFKKGIYWIALLFTTALFSQTRIASKGDSTELPKKNIQIIDTVAITQPDGDFSKVQYSITVKDTTVYQLEDLYRAKKIDSLWLHQLYNNDLFEEIYGSVTEMNFEPTEYEELPTEVLKKRLKELDARTPFHVEYNPSLESVIKGYLKNRRKTMARLMALSDYYFPMFEEELDRQGLPLEMKYLAIVESALDPKATSRVGAKGLWQFMFQTGKLFGLEVSSYVDERCDPIMATEGAAKYLKSLHESLGDWDLALAAYNSGPGNVSKAIRRSGGHTNYWNIRDFLPRETAGYVPAFLATMYIFEYAEEHGFNSHGPKFPYIATDTLKVKRMITLEQVAKVTNLDLAEVEFLNPSYKLGIIPVVKDEDYVLRLPVDAIGKFLNNEEAIYALADKEFNDREKPLPELVEQNDKIRYRVKSGDYLGKIAEKYGVSVAQIKQWNGLRSTRLHIGQRLTIYPRKVSGSAASSVTSTAKSTNPKIYTVKQGDTLWSISKKFPGISIDDLKKWNDISGSNLKPGMTLKVSKG